MAQKKKEAKPAPVQWEDVPEIPREQQPYPLPPGWKWVRLGEIATIESGGTPATNNEEYYANGDIPWICPSDLSDYRDIYISRGKRNISEQGLKNSSAKILPVDSVCLTTRAPVGYVCIAANELSTNQGFKNFLPSPLYFPRYLYWYLKGNKAFLETYASGTTFKEISGQRAKQILFPLPSLQTQQRIVARIESLFSKLDEAAEKVQAVIDSHEARKQAILHRAFSGELTRNIETDDESAYRDIPELPKEQQPYPLPKGWKWVRLGEVLRLQAGKNITSKDISELQTEEFPYPCYGGNGLRGYVKKFNKEGNYCLIGRQGALCGNIHQITGKFYATEHAVVVDGKIYIDINYVSKYLAFMNLNQYATATAQPGLAVGNILSLPFLLPPLETQRRLGKRIESLFSKLDSILVSGQETLEKINQLRKSILNKAFRGELT